MDLRKFIAETLTQIVGGINDAQEKRLTEIRRLDFLKKRVCASLGLNLHSKTELEILPQDTAGFFGA